MRDTYRRDIARDAIRGLTAQQKFIPSKYFYDERGSTLFEKICLLPEYYPTRIEMDILRKAAPKIMRLFESGDLVELGSGANWKIRILLDTAGYARRKNLRYVPVDVSEDALIKASEELGRIYPEVEVLGIVADFIHHMDMIPFDRPRIIMFLGSTIGNFSNRTRRDFLRLVSESMRPDDRFIVGFDTLKTKQTLEDAYNDTRGITSQFNKNILHVINRELNANFDLSHFDHLAFFNDRKKRIEMHLRANRRTTVSIDDVELEIDIEKDETIHTENSYKFSKKSVEEMASEAGLEVHEWFFDARKWFSIAALALKRGNR